MAGRLTGVPASGGRGAGRAILLADGTPTEDAYDGHSYVLVASITDPSALPLLVRAAAIVLDEGSGSSHAASIARELGIPCVVGTRFATERIGGGDVVAVDGDTGVVRWDPVAVLSDS